MNKMKLPIWLSCRSELFGTGYYNGLSNQYGREYPELTKKFDEFAADEYEHSKLFNKCYSDLFGKNLGGERFWLGSGKCMAHLLFALPVDSKVKNMSHIELLGVKQLEKYIANEKNPYMPYMEAVKRILPDEKKHAEMYKEWKKS